MNSDGTTGFFLSSAGFGFGASRWRCSPSFGLTMGPDEAGCGGGRVVVTQQLGPLLVVMPPPHPYLTPLPFKTSRWLVFCLPLSLLRRCLPVIPILAGIPCPRPRPVLPQPPPCLTTLDVEHLLVVLHPPPLPSALSSSPRIDASPLFMLSTCWWSCIRSVPKGEKPMVRHS